MERGRAAGLEGGALAPAQRSRAVRARCAGRGIPAPLKLKASAGARGSHPRQALLAKAARGMRTEGGPGRVWTRRQSWHMGAPPLKL